MTITNLARQLAIDRRTWAKRKEAFDRFDQLLLTHRLTGQHNGWQLNKINNSRTDPFSRNEPNRQNRPIFAETNPIGRTGQYVPWRLRLLAQTPDAAQRYAMTIVNLAHQLATFERYERRARSKRKTAFERLYAEQCSTEANG